MGSFEKVILDRLKLLLTFYQYLQIFGNLKWVVIRCLLVDLIEVANQLPYTKEISVGLDHII